MKRIARRTLLASAAAVMAAPLAAPALLRVARADAPPVVLKLHHFMSSVSSAHDRFIVPWARKVQADSNGRIRIDIFPSMQLGGAPAHLFDQARDGDAEIVWTTPALTSGRFPRIEMFDLPFVPSRRALVSSMALSDFAAANLKDEFREVRPLCFSCSDRGVIHANQPIRTVEDIKNLRFHAQTRWAGEALYQLGANPVPMPSSQLQAALNAHVIDGCLDPWHLMPGYRLNDVLKMHTEFYDTSPSSTTFVLAMNAAAYDRLPRDLKAVIDSNSGLAAATMAGTMWDLEAASVSDSVVRGGDTITTLLPEAVAHWRKLTEPVVEKWLKEMKEQKTDGGKLLAAAHALMQKYAKEPEPQPPAPPQPPPQQDAVTQPVQTVPSQPPQTVPPQQTPQAGLTAPSNAAPKFNTPAPTTTASTTPPNMPTSAPANVPSNVQWPKPMSPQPMSPHAAPGAARAAAPSSPAWPTPSAASGHAPASAAVAKPVAPTAHAPQIAPQIAAPAPVQPPTPPSTASIVPATKPAAALAPTPPVTAAPVPPAAAPTPPVAAAAPAAKPAAAATIAPTPQPPPAAAPPVQAPPAHVAPAPKSLDIPF